MIRLVAAALALFLLVSPAWATSPSVSAKTIGASAGDTTNHVFTLPACAAGKLLIAGIAIRDSSYVLTWPGGWTSLGSGVTPGSAPSSTQVQLRYKVSTGADSLTVTTDIAGADARIAYCIQGQHASSAPETPAAASGADANPNPPSITPTWGAEDNLFLAIAGNSSTSTASGYPTNYVNGQTQASTVSATNCALSSAERPLTGSPEDPGTFTLTAAQNWAAFTVAIRPAAATCNGGLLLRGAGGC